MPGRPIIGNGIGIPGIPIGAPIPGVPGVPGIIVGIPGIAGVAGALPSRRSVAIIASSSSGLSGYCWSNSSNTFCWRCGSTGTIDGGGATPPVRIISAKRALSSSGVSFGNSSMSFMSTSWCCWLRPPSSLAAAAARARAAWAARSAAAFRRRSWNALLFSSSVFDRRPPPMGPPMGSLGIEIRGDKRGVGCILNLTMLWAAHQLVFLTMSS